MKKYVIGISPRYNKDDNQDFIRISEKYIEAMQADDMIPIILAENDHFESSLALCDAFLCIGGWDMDPAYYGENNDDNLSVNINPKMDKLDEMMVKYAYENNIPLLGICRGIQVVAASLGGSLHQDLNHEHINHPLIDEHHHMVKKITNYGLAALCDDEFLVNSYHHQAVKKLPKDFVILFKNEDTIEGIECLNKPILGVQWHPEKEDLKESKIIFDYFFNLIRK